MTFYNHNKNYETLRRIERWKNGDVLILPKRFPTNVQFLPDADFAKVKTGELSEFSIRSVKWLQSGDMPFYLGEHATTPINNVFVKVWWLHQIGWVSAEVLRLVPTGKK
jgi:hypothetical protein